MNDFEQQRETPLPWSTRDATYAALMCGAVFALFMPQTWVFIADLTQWLVPGIVIVATP